MSFYWHPKEMALDVFIRMLEPNMEGEKIKFIFPYGEYFVLIFEIKG